MSNSRTFARFAWVAPITLVPLAFGGILANGWVNWDDPLHVLENPWLAPVSWRGLGELWSRPYRGLYVPVSYTVFAAEAIAGRAVSGAATPAAVVFHGLSLFLHAACVGLVARLLGRLGATPWAAAAGAALFAVHPLQVESVAWISEQRGLLAALFSLLALNFVVPHDDEHVSLGGAWRDVAATGCFAMALLCKPSAVVVPVLAVVIAMAAGTRRLSRGSAVMLGLWSVLAVAAAGGTKWLQPVDSAIAGPWSLRPIVAGNALTFYAEKVVLPRGLCIDYGLTPAVISAGPAAIIRALTVAVAIAAVAGISSLRTWRVPLALFVVPLLPVLGMVPFSFEAISVVADRYAYLAMLGPAAAVACAVDAWRSRWPHAAVVAGIGALAVVTWAQVPVWRDSLSLNRHALAINHGTRDTLNNLGLTLVDADRLQEAAACFERSIASDPGFQRSRFNLGLARHRAGQLAEAEREYRTALRLDPDYAIAHNNLGILLGQTGRLAEAEAEFRTALAIDPDLAEATRNLARMQALEPTKGGK